MRYALFLFSSSVLEDCLAHQARRASGSTVGPVAYFTVWTALGVIVYGLGTMLTKIQMQHATLARAAPLVAAVCILVAGTLQFTPWKARHLACCKSVQEHRTLTANIPTEWRQGLSFGFRRSCCCLNLTAIFLVLGIMDLRVMAVVTAAITLERLAPAGKAIARTIGAIALGFGASATPGCGSGLT